MTADRTRPQSEKSLVPQTDFTNVTRHWHDSDPCDRAIDLELLSGLIATVAKRVTPEAPMPASKKAASGTIGLDLETQSFFGNKIKELREAAGWSQEELAQRVGMAQTKLPAIEQGRRDVHISTVRRFAKAFDRPLRDLLPPD